MNIAFALYWFVSIFSYSIQTTNGTQVNLSQFSGKNILIVNVASNSRYSNQLSELETLYQQHKDSLVVIAFPTDDFGSEPLNDSALNDLFRVQLNVNYIVAKKSNIIGQNMHPIFKWLSDPSLNEDGRTGNASRDFQKILIGKNGKINGQFNSMVSPLDPAIKAALSIQ